MAGNVAEMLREEGFLKGGSWKTTAFYLRNDFYQKEDSLSRNDVGFRIVFEVAE